MGAIIFVIACFALVIVLNLIVAKNRVESTTQTATGTICDVSRERDEADMIVYFWHIRYHAKGWHYELRQEAHGITSFSMHSHVGESVTVHYDPQAPDRAWAETPGRPTLVNKRAKAVDGP